MSGNGCSAASRRARTLLSTKGRRDEATVRDIEYTRTCVEVGRAIEDDEMEDAEDASVYVEAEAENSD